MLSIIGQKKELPEKRVDENKSKIDWSLPLIYNVINNNDDDNINRSVYSCPSIIQPLITQTLGYPNNFKSNTTIKIFIATW